tara:strand:+ start:2053 stop:2706 length:654 start_codon:yes stop_codon:yes gene_type:complete
MKTKETKDYKAPYKVVDGFKMIDSRKDRDGNILQVIVEEVFDAKIMLLNRKRDTVDARRIYSFILRERGYRYTKIGRFLQKNHATILHYTRDINVILKTNPSLMEKYLLCKKIFLEDLERADAIKAESHDSTFQSAVYSMNQTIKKLEQQVEYLEVRNQSLTNQNEWYDKEISQYNPKLNTLYKIITDRTKADTVTKLSKKLNTLYNGVYSEAIEIY